MNKPDEFDLPPSWEQHQKIMKGLTDPSTGKVRFHPEFHDLCHPIWDCYDGLQGRIRHVKHWWIYKARQEFRDQFEKLFYCWRNKHQYNYKGWFRTDPDPHINPVTKDSTWEQRIWCACGKKKNPDDSSTP